MNPLPKKYLETTDKAKKDNYLDACLKHRQHFTPFVVSVEGVIRVKVEATLKRIDSRLAKKRKERYSQTYRYANIMIVITLVWAAYHCMCGTRFPAS